MNLGAGLSAATGFFQAQEHSQDRDYLAKQRDYQAAQMQAGLSTLDDWTASDRARAKLAAAQSGAGLDMLPGQTANALRQQGLDRGGLDFKQQQQPIEQANTAKRTTITGAGLDMAVSNIPAAQQANDANNRDAFTAQHINDFAQFGRLVQMGDKAGAMAHAQSVSDSEAKRAGSLPKKILGYRMTGDKTTTGDNRAYTFVYEDGSEVPIPHSAVSGSMAMASAKTGKYSMKQGRAGDVQVLNENTGEVQTKVAADPNYARSAGTNQHTPAQLQLVNAYMEAPENKGMTFSQAWDKVRTSMDKPRHQAILELVGKDTVSLSTGVDANKLYQKWADMYDRARQNPSEDRTQQSAPGLPANSPLAPTINPKYQNLFTP